MLDFPDTLPLFTIIEDGGKGKVYRIYPNGKIEGFPSGSLVVNRIPPYRDYLRLLLEQYSSETALSPKEEGQPQ